MKDYLKIAAMVLCLGVVAFIVDRSFSVKTGKNGNIDLEIAYAPTFSEAGAPPLSWTVYEIASERFGINLKLTPLPGKSTEQEKILRSRAENNNLPDMFPASGDLMNDFIAQEKIAPVDEMYALMPLRSERMYGKQERGSYLYEGKHYALTQTGAISRNEGVLIRKDWLDNLRLPVPVTTDDFLHVMKMFTVADPDGNGRNDTYGFGAYIEVRKNEEGLGTRFQPIFGAFGCEGTIDLRRATAGLNIYKPEYYDALEYIKSMVDAKVIDPNWTEYSKAEFRDAWKEGRFGIMREQNAALALQQNYEKFDEAFPDGQWIVVDPPMNKGRSSVGVYTTQGHRIFAVSKKCADEGHQKKLAQFLEWMSSDEGYMLLGFGIRGVNYNLDSKGMVTTDNLVDPEKAYSKPAFAPQLQLRNLVFYNSDIELAGRYPTWKTKNGRDISALEYLREMQSKKWTQNFGADRIPSPSSELKKFYEKGVIEFVTGKRTLTRENWNAWLAEFDEKGGKDWNTACLAFAEENGLLTD